MLGSVKTKNKKEGVETIMEERMYCEGLSFTLSLFFSLSTSLSYNCLVKDREEGGREQCIVDGLYRKERKIYRHYSLVCFIVLLRKKR